MKKSLKRKKSDDAMVEEASMESFPASDPPAWTSGKSVEEHSATIDISKVQADWSKRGFSCDIWTDIPGQRWENFKHKTDELFELLEGNVELELNGKVKHVLPGEEILIPAHTLHSVRNKGKSLSRWLYGYKK